ncbi:MAG TPA: ABC transporter permease [Herbaspirillum sp.]|jgi:NitT/TauT family transport system permease protein
MKQTYSFAGASIWPFIGRWYSLPLLLICWQLAVVTGLVASRLMPDLVAIWHAFATDILNGALLRQAGITMGRALTGFALALIVGVPLAAVMARSKLFARLLEPTFFAGYPVPKIALYPIFTFLFGLGTPSKIAFTFLECLYPIVVTTYLGISAIPNVWIWAADNMGADRKKIFYRVLVPAALPSIFSGIRIALPIAITIVVVTEIIGDSAGLGFYITNYSTRFRYDNVYAGILMIGICGFLFDRIVIWARQRFVYWESENRH